MLNSFSVAPKKKPYGLSGNRFFVVFSSIKVMFFGESISKTSPIGLTPEIRIASKARRKEVSSPNNFNRFLRPITSGWNKSGEDFKTKSSPSDSVTLLESVILNECALAISARGSLKLWGQIKISSQTPRPHSTEYIQTSKLSACAGSKASARACPAEQPISQQVCRVRHRLSFLLCHLCRRQKVRGRCQRSIAPRRSILRTSEIAPPFL